LSIFLTTPETSLFALPEASLFALAVVPVWVDGVWADGWIAGACVADDP
jgi:hypothetical protein